MKLELSLHIIHHPSRWLRHAIERLTMNQTELAQALADVKTQGEKAKAEIVGKITTLEAAIASAGTTTPEVDAALAALKGTVQGLDDVVPDAAP